MTRKQAREAYKEIQLSKQEKEVLLNRILSASGRTAPGGKDSIMRKRKYRPAILAAIVALMVLLMGCAWVVMRFDDLVIGEKEFERTHVDEGTGELITEPVEVRHILSLQGIAGSPNYQAVKEWLEFKETYDPDLSLLDEDGFQAGPEYDAYSAYTQEMVDKIDEICGKYGLQPAGQIVYVDPWQTDVMMDVLGIPTFLKGEVQDVYYSGGYFYSCGNFKMEGNFTLASQEAAWKDEVHFSYRYTNKGYLDTVFLALNPDTVTQWNYTCADGTEILIVLGEDQGYLFCDREDAFLTVSFYSEDIMSEDGPYMTQRDMELVAEAIDFSVKPGSFEMKEAVMALADATAAYNETKPPREPWGYDSMVEWMIPWRIETFEDPPQLYYAMLDFDEDGVVDMLMGYEEEFTNMWTLDYLGDAKPHDFVVTQYWDELSALWLTLEKTRIEDYPLGEN